MTTDRDRHTIQALRDQLHAARNELMTIPLLEMRLEEANAQLRRYREGTILPFPRTGSLSTPGPLLRAANSASLHPIRRLSLWWRQHCADADGYRSWRNYRRICHWRDLIADREIDQAIDQVDAIVFARNDP